MSRSFFWQIFRKDTAEDHPPCISGRILSLLQTTFRHSEKLSRSLPAKKLADILLRNIAAACCPPEKKRAFPIYCELCHNDKFFIFFIVFHGTSERLCGQTQCSKWYSDKYHLLYSLLCCSPVPTPLGTGHLFLYSPAPHIRQQKSLRKNLHLPEAPFTGTARRYLSGSTPFSFGLLIFSQIV